MSSCVAASLADQKCAVAGDSDCRYSLQCDGEALTCSCPAAKSVSTGAACTPKCTNQCHDDFNFGNTIGECINNVCGEYYIWPHPQKLRVCNVFLDVPSSSGQPDIAAQIAVLCCVTLTPACCTESPSFTLAALLMCPPLLCPSKFVSASAVRQRRPTFMLLRAACDTISAVLLLIVHCAASQSKWRVPASRQTAC